VKRIGKLSEQPRNSFFNLRHTTGAALLFYFLTPFATSFLYISEIIGQKWPSIRDNGAVRNGDTGFGTEFRCDALLDIDTRQVGR
jgi:hypothetical protein